MWSKSLNLIIVCFMVMVLLIIIGCDGDEGSVGPSESEVIIYANANKLHSQDITADITAYVYDCLGIPEVKINGTSMECVSQLGKHFSLEDFSISSGEQIRLFAGFTLENGMSGSAVANIIMPGPFEIISPTTAADITLTDSIVFLWTSSSYAQDYCGDIRIEYLYYENESIEYGNNFPGFGTTDTVKTVAPSWIFPNLEDIDSLYWFDCNVQVLASNGPKIDNYGNIEGDAEGAFYAEVCEHVEIVLDSLASGN